MPNTNKCTGCPHIYLAGAASNVSYIPMCDKSRRRQLFYYTRPSKIGLVAVLMEEGAPEWCPLLDLKTKVKG